MESKTHVGSQKIMVSLFRREKELLVGIVPLTRFQTVYYEMPPIKNKIGFEDHVLLIHINQSNIDLFIDFLESSQSRFECFLRTDIANLIGMINSGILYVYCLKRMDAILSVYIFRDTRISYDEFGGVLQLVASINQCSQEMFINGFLNSLFEILQKMPVYKILMVDEIADNMLLMNLKTKIRTRIVNNYWTAYYLYNMVAMPVKNGNIFICL
jgi:hypothetical protein